jgi:hypothetical protein
MRDYGSGQGRSHRAFAGEPSQISLMVPHVGALGIAPAFGKYRIVRQVDESYDIVAVKSNGRLIVPGFKTQDDARIWIAAIEPEGRSERRDRDD